MTSSSPSPQNQVHSHHQHLTFSTNHHDFISPSSFFSRSIAHCKSLSPHHFNFVLFITHSGSIDDDDDDDRVRCGCREGASSLPIKSEMVSSFEMFKANDLDREWVKIDLVSEISGFLRGFATVTSSEPALAKLEAKCAVALPECSTVEEDITKIRHEFELAKQRFLNIPEAINSMPKMNPQG